MPSVYACAVVVIKVIAVACVAMMERPMAYHGIVFPEAGTDSPYRIRARAIVHKRPGRPARRRERPSRLPSWGESPGKGEEERDDRGQIDQDGRVDSWPGAEDRGRLVRDIVRFVGHLKDFLTQRPGGAKQGRGHSAFPALRRLANARYAPGTPAGSCRNQE